MLVIEESNHKTIEARLEGVKRFTSELSKVVESELLPFVEDSSRELVFDLKGIHFIDSAAFDTLLHIHKKANESKSKFILSNLDDEAKELFDLLKLNDVFQFSKN